VIPPSGWISPVIDGDVTSYFEWMGAGLYEAELKSGAMHGRRFFVREAAFGSDGEKLYIRIDFLGGVDLNAGGLEIRITIHNPARSELQSHWTIGFPKGAATVLGTADPAVACAFQRVLEVAVPLQPVEVHNAPVRFQLSVWNEDLPMDSVPASGWIEFSTSDPETWEN